MLTASILGEDIEASLPAGVAGADVTWVGVWCRAYSVDFGHVWLIDNIPASASSNHISLLMIVSAVLFLVFK